MNTFFHKIKIKEWHAYEESLLRVCRSSCLIFLIILLLLPIYSIRGQAVDIRLAGEAIDSRAYGLRSYYDPLFYNTLTRRIRGERYINNVTSISMPEIGDISEHSFLKSQGLSLQANDISREMIPLLDKIKWDSTYKNDSLGVGSSLLGSVFLDESYNKTLRQNYIYAIDGRLDIPYAFGQFTIGARHSGFQKQQGDDSQSGEVTKLDGRVKLTDILVLSGGFTQRSGKLLPDDDVAVDARTQVGSVSIGASYSSLDSSANLNDKDKKESLLTGSWELLSLTDLIKNPMGIGDDIENQVPGGSDSSGGITTTTKVGFILGEPGRNELQIDHELTQVKGVIDKENLGIARATTSFALQYALTDALIFQAGYKLSSPFTALEGKGEEETTRLGVGYKVPLNGEGLLSAYYVYERIKDLLAIEGGQEMLTASTELEYKLTEDTTLKANYLFGGSATAGRMLSTSLGVGYSFNMNASLSVGYKMVDFDNYIDAKEKFRANMTMAEIMIKF